MVTSKGCSGFAPPDEVSHITLGMLGTKGLTHPFDIFQRPQHAAHALEVARAGFELARRAGRTL